MLTKDFDYILPKSLIAQKPLSKREQSRMMVLNRKKKEIIHSWFKDFPASLNEGDVLVLNNTRVIPARIWGKKEGKEIEFLFLKPHRENVWEVLCRPARRLNLNDVILFSDRHKGKVVKVEPEGKRVIEFSLRDVLSWLKKNGFAPLPPYIKRKKKDASLKAFDLKRYQTVFAETEGAIAAPTAGLHFTPQILKKIKEKGVKIVFITLDVGQATFQPVRAERIEDHRMGEETYFISQEAARIIEEAKAEAKPVIAVGTTSVRALESAYRSGKIHPGRNQTSLFIRPGYEFKVVDRLLTNFHLPRSSLLMLTAAFAGLDFIKKAYQEAVDQKYRFFSYGDCMLIV
jgi:S-adenosylmethionine:tRNA ribosyltransferase-isomerase